MVELYATARAARRGLRAREGGALGLSRRILAAWQAALLAAALCFAASFAPSPALAEETAASEEAVAPVSEVEQAMNQVPVEEGMFALLYADDTLVLQRGNTPDPSRGELAEAYALNDRWGSLSSCLGSKVGIVTSVIVEDPFVLGEYDGSFFGGCRRAVRLRDFLSWTPQL